jgi:uncharacterized cysteine cluster protein YcgN (CxxCxxCC family)
MTDFWEKPITELSKEEWEALCDGCGKCCLHKLEDDTTGDIYPTNVACKLLDRRSSRCSDYANRKTRVPDCVRLTPELVDKLDWLPSTCAYKLRREGKPLYEWHYLISRDRESVHRAGMSVRGWTVSEEDAGELEYHMVEREL